MVDDPVRPVIAQPAVTVADLDPAGDPGIDVAIRLARPWRRAARAGLYDRHLAPEDRRSVIRTSF
jgi:hypothetical protein